jgi:hypothetical protein
VAQEPVHERLRQAREVRGETIAALARRICVGERLLEAIDEGRFADLPGGIYARTAIRRYAAALAFDPDEVLSECEPSLNVLEDAVSALARLKGLRPAPAPKPPVTPPRAQVAEESSGPIPCPAWRPLVAVTIDGMVVGGLLAAAIAGAIPMSGMPAESFGQAAAPVFVLLGCLLASCYFLLFGGVACVTAGERVVGMRVGRRNPRHIDPRTMGARALRCAARDVRYILRLGVWAAPAIWPGPSGERRDATPIGHAAGQ